MYVCKNRSVRKKSLNKSKKTLIKVKMDVLPLRLVGIVHSTVLHTLADSRMPGGSWASGDLRLSTRSDCGARGDGRSSASLAHVDPAAAARPGKWWNSASQSTTHKKKIFFLHKTKELNPGHYWRNNKDNTYGRIRRKEILPRLTTVRRTRIPAVISQHSILSEFYNTKKIKSTTKDV